MLSSRPPQGLISCLQGSYLDQPNFGAVPTQPVSSRPEADILVEMRNVHKAFGEKKVLRGCNITIRRGEAVGIIGSSGSGKSTTLRLMAGLVAPDWVCTRLCIYQAQYSHQTLSDGRGFPDCKEGLCAAGLDADLAS